MNFLLNNIGNIILGICGVIVLCSTGGSTQNKNTQIEDDDWYHNPVNPNGPNWRGI